jgi:capsid assembly protease
MEIGSLLLQRISSSPWMVRPEFMNVLQNVVDLKFSKEQLDNLSLAFRPKVDEEEKETPFYEVYGNKLLINVEGTLMKKASYLDAMCGMIGMDKISTLLREADADESIEQIVFNWDCPGGTAQGTPELANQVFSMRKSKRLTSFISGQMCSAAYFIGSACDEIYSESMINDVGSIGVVALHVSRQEYDKDMGLKYTYLTAGKYKAMGNPHEDLNDESKAELMRSINYSYKIFTDAVQKYRPQLNISEVAEGRVFKTGEAVDNKLIDGLCSLADILNN